MIYNLHTNKSLELKSVSFLDFEASFFTGIHTYPSLLFSSEEKLVSFKSLLATSGSHWDKFSASIPGSEIYITPYTSTEQQFCLLVFLEECKGNVTNGINAVLRATKAKQ